MKKQLKKKWLTGAAVCQAMFFASTASAVVIGFDGGTVTLQDGSTLVTSNTSTEYPVMSYVEKGVLMQLNTDTQEGVFVGNYYGPDNAVIHAHWDAVVGTNLQFIVFSMLDGSAFDLNYMDITSNTVNGGWSADGTENSWVTSSNGATMKLPSADWGSIENPQRIWLSSDFDNISSFTVTSTNAYCFGMDNFYINEPPPVNPDDPDTDGDGITDSNDNCLMAPNEDQRDSDADGMGDACDACPYDSQNDIDADGICGDDGGCSTIDNCPDIANPDQSDEYSDGLGNVCDDDDDNDGVLDSSDNCQFDVNPDQADLDQDGFGDICDTDSDGDNVIDATDQCLGTASGAVINSDGCAIDQICPCATSWKNHGGYVKCVAHAAHNFLDAGLITVEQREEYVSSAARSECGHKKPKRNLRGSKGHNKKQNVHGSKGHGKKNGSSKKGSKSKNK